MVCPVAIIAVQISLDNPYIKVTWADTHDAFTPEKIKRVKAYFQEKYNTRFIKINTKVLNTNTNSKLKTL